MVTKARGGNDIFSTSISVVSYNDGESACVSPLIALDATNFFFGDSDSNLMVVEFILLFNFVFVPPRIILTGTW